MAIELRQYQADAVKAIENEWSKGRQKTLLVFATGCGKTITFAKIAQNIATKGGRTLILAHRGELLTQAADKIKQVTGLSSSLEKAQSTSLGEWNSVVVGSVQTLTQDKRLKAFSPDAFDAIVIDEAHHATSDSYQKILEHFDRAKVLGVTATPDRSDRKSLGEVFDSIAYEYQLPNAIKDGYLCPIEALCMPLKVDIAHVHMQNGDWAAGELGDALAPYLDAIADEMVEAGCKDRKTVVFLPLVQTAKNFRDKLVERGFRAAEVDGMSEDRNQILQDFDSGKYNVLCNSMLLTEGWDCPSVDCLVVLRPTKSRALYTQMVGRGTRLHKGKDKLLLLDFLWQTGKVDLCRPASLMTDNERIQQKMQEVLERDTGQEAVDLEELQAQAETEAQQDREAALAEHLKQMRHKKKRLVDPLQYEMSICDVDLSDYEPTFAWEMREVSDNQLKWLETNGIDASGMCMGKASLLIDKMQKRQELGLATPKQIRMLERYDFKSVGEWLKEEATAMISEISRNGWRKPRFVNPPTYIPESLRCR